MEDLEEAHSSRPFQKPAHLIPLGEKQLLLKIEADGLLCDVNARLRALKDSAH